MAIIVQMGSTLSRPLPLWTLKKGKHLLNMMQPVLWIKDGRRASFQVSGLLKCPSSPKPGYGPAFLLFPPAWKVTLTWRQVTVSSIKFRGPQVPLSFLPSRGFAQCVEGVHGSGLQPLLRGMFQIPVRGRLSSWFPVSVQGLVFQCVLERRAAGHFQDGSCRLVCPRAPVCAECSATVAMEQTGLFS